MKAHTIWRGTWSKDPVQIRRHSSSKCIVEIWARETREWFQANESITEKVLAKAFMMAYDKMQGIEMNINDFLHSRD